MSISGPEVGISGAGAIGGGLIVHNTREGVAEKEQLNITHVADDFHTASSFAKTLRDSTARPGVDAHARGDVITIGNQRIKMDKVDLEHEVPDWNLAGIEHIFAASGLRVQEEKAQEHIDVGGAHNVHITAPAKGEVQTLIVGHNEAEYDPAIHRLTTNESCTTKSLIHIVRTLRNLYGVQFLFLETIHAATGGERRNILENSGRVDDVQKLGFTLQGTGAQQALSKAFPDIEIIAGAARVHAADNSVSSASMHLGKPIDIEAAANELRNAPAAKVREILMEMTSLDITVEQIADDLTRAQQERIWQVIPELKESSSLLDNTHDAVVGKSSIKVARNHVSLHSGYDNGFAPVRSAHDSMKHIISKA